jgi:hypothetical protein
MSDAFDVFDPFEPFEPLVAAGEPVGEGSAGEGPSGEERAAGRPAARPAADASEPSRESRPPRRWTTPPARPTAPPVADAKRASPQQARADAPAQPGGPTPPVADAKRASPQQARADAPAQPDAPGRRLPTGADFDDALDAVLFGPRGPEGEPDPTGGPEDGGSGSAALVPDADLASFRAVALPELEAAVERLSARGHLASLADDLGQRESAVVVRFRSNQGPLAAFGSTARKPARLELRMYWIIKLVQSLVKALNSEGTPGQVAAGMAVGACLGLTPLLNLHNLLIVAGHPLLPGLGAGGDARLDDLHAGGLPPRSGVRPVGRALLMDADGLRPVWATAYNTPVIALANPTNTIVVGSFVGWLVLSIPIFFLARFGVARYRATIYERYKDARFFKAVRGSKLYNTYRLFRP